MRQTSLNAVTVMVPLSRVNVQTQRHLAECYSSHINERAVKVRDWGVPLASCGSGEVGPRSEDRARPARVREPETAQKHKAFVVTSNKFVRT